MANDVSIIVSADLGDTLIKLDLAKHAVKDLGDQSEETAAKQDAAAASTGFFSSALTELQAVLGPSVPLLFGMSAPLVAIPVVAAAAAAAVIVLADAVGTLVAIVADFIAPATLALGLVGGLGAAFAVAAKQAFGMHEDGFGRAIAGLKDQFDQLTHTLVADFMPVFQFLIHNAHDALSFLNQIAKLPLDEAFRRLAQQGIPALTHFLEQVGHIVARPIRLAFQIAFGTGRAGNEASAAVSRLWNDLSNFLFGYSKTHILRLDGRAIQISQQHVDGIFQPLIDWFNRHHFTQQGIKIGHEILNGVTNSGAAKRLGQFFVTALEDAFKTIGEAAKANLGYHLWPLIEALAVNAWNAIKALAIRSFHEDAAALESAFRSAWDAVKGAAQDAWNAIIGIFSHPLSVVLNVIPHLLGSLPGNSNPLPGRGGGGASPSPVGRAVVMHNTFNLHAGVSQAAFSRQVREIGRELARQQHILAGGA